jgi:hypothetical protein
MVPDGDARNKKNANKKKAQGKSAAAFSCKGASNPVCTGNRSAVVLQNYTAPLKFLHPEQMEPKTTENIVPTFGADC